MSITTNQYNRVLARLTALENAHNDLVVASEAFITLGQMNQLLTLLQTDMDDLSTQVDALNDRVEALENEPLT
jgi:polyhydroxyalkanoate synthesis regulator phasin